MASSTPSSPPLVWATQGKSQHPAYLMDSNDDLCLVRWSSTNTTDWVHQNDVTKQLTPRRQRRADEAASSHRIEYPERESKTPPSESGKRKMSECDIHNDESHDDEVEVLLTILPPTPKRTKQKFEADTSATFNEARRVSTSPMAGLLCQDEESSLEVKNTRADVMNSSAAQGSAETNLCPAAHGSSSAKCDSAQEQKPQYSFQSSAYVQSLAEICYTILFDRRWRVEGRTRKRLFAWERGDDLSAVHLLSKLFTPPKKRPATKCSCLLCRDVREESKSCVKTHGELSAITNLDLDPLTEHGPDHAQDHLAGAPKVITSSEIDDEAVRSIYLYCRLYYRKGPWFRLDDIYIRYYAPKKRFTSPENKENLEETEAAAEFDDTALEESRKSFFKRSSSSQIKASSGGQRNGVKKDNVIDQAAIQGHISAVMLMLNDIHHLNAIGLMRSFHNEEECGKTAGAVTPDGSGILLRAEERRAIVAKLGGASKLDKKRRAANLKGTSGRQRSMDITENAIWKQMSQQRSISLGVPNGANKTKVLLPVCRHVNDALFDKLATSIVLASIRVGNVPASVLRLAVSDVKTTIRGLMNSSSHCVSMCVTLREAPLLTLRRCARLYLCATSGPGDMRGDGTNAWRSLRDTVTASVHPDVPLSNVIQPPGAHSWHGVIHPTLSHRFGITSCAFVDAHEFLDCDDDSGEIGDTNTPESITLLHNYDADLNRAAHEQIFDTIDAFHLWEASVEVRAHVDYHLELNDAIMYQARRQARESNAGEKQERENMDAKNAREEPSVSFEDDIPCLSLTSESRLDLDFLELLSVHGRKSMIQKLLALSYATSKERNMLASRMIDRVHQEAEHSITRLEVFIGDESMRASKSDGSTGNELFQTDSQRIIVVMSIIILHVLIDRNLSITTDEVALKKARPWLRHLYWEGILAYALWDCIPLLERLKFYDLACSCLEVILYGKLQKRENIDSFEPGEQVNDDHCWSLPELLVSRRTRGKAHERLMIDYVHLLRWKTKTDSVSATNDTVCTAGSELKGNREKDRSAIEREVTPQDVVRCTVSRVVRTVARAGSIPFSAVRSLARRLKVPLTESLEDLHCEEVSVLGLRLSNANDTAAVDPQNKKPKTYIDWLPPIDTATANALASEETLVGQRCSYVGFEDNASSGAETSSLNVEQLAMEYYASGRLPVAKNDDADLSGGGWSGWHNEGGHVRALFRIICARPILGIDLGCGSESSSPLENLERLTIHLTPYQGAPFDLHVAHWCESSLTSEAENAESQDAVRSFYQRRRIQIDRFLNKLERLSGQALCDLVYDSIIARLDSAGHGRVQDALLARDLQQIRTLSMLAAGFGGLQLSAMFRCLLFDYRHYSGGLPDLLLVRARIAESEKPLSLVDLGAWVGEAFSAESKMELEVVSRATLLIDKDDEFLGCSKIGDSGAQSSARWRRGAQRQPSRDNATRQSNELCIEKLPSRLVLRHNDRNVQVQCMFVEVKSLNDRLDGRQEDWLNVLDRVGNARVCKFGNGKKSSMKSAVAK